MRHLDELLLHYNRFMALWILSGTTRVSRHQKGKTRKVNLHLAPDTWPRQHPTTQIFYRPDALPATLINFLYQ